MLFTCQSNACNLFELKRELNDIGMSNKLWEVFMKFFRVRCKNNDLRLVSIATVASIHFYEDKEFIFTIILTDGKEMIGEILGRNGRPLGSLSSVLAFLNLERKIYAHDE